MIRSFVDQNLHSIWLEDGVTALPTDRVKSIRLILDLLHAATVPADVELPSLRLNHLGEQADGRIRFAIVRANKWQILFSWQDSDAYDVALELFM